MTFGERVAPYLYDALLYGATPVVGPVLLARGRRHGKYLPVLRERLGLEDASPPVGPGGVVWLHAVSAGEVLVARTLARALGARGERVVLSATTLAGLGLARAALEAGDVAGVLAAPLDYHGAVRRAFARVRPKALVLVEAEIWPNWLGHAARLGVPTALVNARITERSFRRYRRFAALFRPIFAGLAAVGARTDEDDSLLRDLGVRPERLRTTGDVKLDAPAPGRDREAERRELRIQASDALVLVAGSVHPGEETAVLGAFRVLLTHDPRATLVLAPRKPLDLAAASGLKVVTRTSGDVVPPGGILLLDTMGELRDAYAAGDMAFVGGSLVPARGHNLVEPAAAGVPVLFGPSTETFADVAALLIGAGAARRVAGATGLATEIGALARDPGARASAGLVGRAVVDASRGTVARTVALLEETLGIGGLARS